LPDSMPGGGDMKNIGRNDPCPCGSGRKFKHCHIGKEDELFLDGMSEISPEMSARITGLDPVHYGRSEEMVGALDIKELTGSSVGIRFIGLREYDALNMFGQKASPRGKESDGGVIVNMLKTGKSDPDNIYIAISPRISDSALAHQLAHVLDYLGGSKLVPGIAGPLSLDLGVPVEHIEHPHEFGHWLAYLQGQFSVLLDADDSIITYIYKNGMLIKGEDIRRQDPLILKKKSDRILEFLSRKSSEIDVLIRELPGYIGSRVEKK